MRLTGKERRILNSGNCDCTERQNGTIGGIGRIKAFKAEWQLPSGKCHGDSHSEAVVVILPILPIVPSCLSVAVAVPGFPFR